MSPKNKLALRRWVIRKLRLLFDAIDDRLHTAEVRLREDLHGAAGTDHTGAHQVKAGNCPIATDETAQEKPNQHRGETFEQWEARKSGVRIAPKPRRRRGIPSAEFNRRMAAQLEEIFTEAK